MHFVRDFSQKLLVEDVKNEAFVQNTPQTTASCRCKSNALVGDVPQNLKVEDVQAKFSCEISLKNGKLIM
jgi:hypothetical protein